MSAAASSVPPLDLVCLGEAMVEFNQARDEPTRYTAGFGGDTSNCAIAAARIGARSGYITQIGDDVFGSQLLALWRDEGIDTGGVRVVAGGDTGVYFVTHDADLALAHADRILLMREGRLVADGPPMSVIADRDRWLACNLRFTSLMEANRRWPSADGRFESADVLAARVASQENGGGIGSAG